MHQIVGFRGFCTAVVGGDDCKVLVDKRLRFGPRLGSRKTGAKLQDIARRRRGAVRRMPRIGGNVWSNTRGVCIRIGARLNLFIRWRGERLLPGDYTTLAKRIPQLFLAAHGCVGAQAVAARRPVNGP